jgi:hypothetical protein
MTRDQIKAMLMAVFEKADPALAKSFVPNYAEREMNGLIDIVEKHIDGIKEEKKVEKKSAKK